MMVDDVDIAELVDAVEQVTAIYRKPLPHPLGRQGFKPRDSGAPDTTILCAEPELRRFR